MNKLTDEQIEAFAHRIATRYTHRSDPKDHSYAFVRSTLLQFARAIEAALAAPPATEGEPIPGEAYRSSAGMVCGRCGCADLMYEGAAAPSKSAEAPAVDAASGAVHWDEAERISNLPAVDEAIRNLLEDQTGDNSTCMVRAVLQAAGATVMEAGSEGDLDPRRALDYARQMKTYCEAFNDRNWSSEMLLGSVDTQNLATALDNLTECAAMLMNMASRIATPTPVPAAVMEDKNG